MPSSAFWACAAVTLVSAAVSFGFSVVPLRTASRPVGSGSLYAFSRSLALLATAVVAPVTGAAPFVAAIAVAMIAVQVGDAVVGVRIHDRLKTVGPAATALVNLAALIWLLVS